MTGTWSNAEDVDVEKGQVGVEEKTKPEMILPSFPSSGQEMQLVTELIFAASTDDTKTAEELLDKISPNLGDYDHRTALHVAASEGKLESVKLLLSRGAEINVVDRWGDTPLDGAAMNGCQETGSYLLSNGGCYGKKNHNTTLRLIQAVSDNDVEHVKKILSMGFDPNCGDYDHRTPLHIAVAVKNLEIAKLLIEHGADVHAVDRFGGTPMSDAQARAPRFGKDEMRDYLLEHGGRVHKDIDDDNKIDIGFLLAGIQCVFFILYGVFVEYGEGASGEDPDALEMQKYPQFTDVHVMIFIGFGMLMLFLKKYAYSAITYNFMLSIIVIQWHILVNGFFHNAFLGEWKKIHLTITEFILADFASAVILITFGAILGKVTKPSQLVVIALLEVIFFSINENIGLKLHISDIGGSMVLHAFGAYFGLGVSYILCPPEAKSHKDNSANYVSDLFSMVGSIFLWMFWPSFNSALAGPYDKERAVINTVLSLTASGLGAFSASWLLRGEKKFDMVDIQNASIAGGVAVGTTANMMLGPFGAQIIGFLGGWLSVAGYVFIQPFLERKVGVYDTCGVHNLHGMPGVLAGLAGIIVAGIANTSRYNTEENYGAVFYYVDEPGKQAGLQAAFLFITLGMAITTGLLTGLMAKAACGRLQPRVYNDDRFFENAFR